MSPQMKKMLIILSIIFGIIFGWYIVRQIFWGWIFAHYTPPPVTISASTAALKTWEPYLSAIGTLTAVNGADISTEIGGTVKEIHFESGQYVNQGDILIILDSSIEAAQLKDNQAKLKLAQLNYARDQTLARKNVISPALLDKSFAELQQAEAGVEVTGAKIRQKMITAPFAGKVGIRQINQGEFISPGTLVVTLQSLDPLYVRFNLPEQYLPELYLQQPIEVSFNLSDGKSVTGMITAINSKVDQATRNILVQATIANKEMRLYPGMFARIKVWLRQKNQVITLPETAIAYSLHGDSVFIIKKEGKGKKALLKVDRQYVKVGERRGDEVAILQGLKTGDRVATSGQLKLQNGTPVVIDNNVEF